MRAVQLTAYGNPVEGLMSTFPSPRLPDPTRSLSGGVFTCQPERPLARTGIYGIRPHFQP